MTRLTSWTRPHAPQDCPVCTETLAAATGLGDPGVKDTPPEPGDLCLCAYCGTWLKVQPDPFPWTVATAAEIARQDPALRRAVERAVADRQHTRPVH